jgi:soluble lytic murein transglycosylase
VVHWFNATPPQSDRGRFAYWRALWQSGQQTKAMSVAKQFWRDGHFNQEQQATLIATAGRHFTSDDHATRLDILLWQGQLDRAMNGLRFVSAERRAIGQARIALQRVSSTAPALIQSLSSRSLQDHGLLFDRVRYARIKENNNFAASLLAQFRGNPGMHSALWWRERNILARRALERGEYQTAYRLAAAHGALEGIPLAEAEWLSGWIATTRLKQPEKGLRHFDHMYHNVKSPLSVSRSAYWAGVAGPQLGRQKDSNARYKHPSSHMHNF